MKKAHRRTNPRILSGAAAPVIAIALAALLTPSSALASEASDAGPDSEKSKDEIVVTGTLVRGVAPTGSNVIGVSSAAIKETGAATTAQLLQTVPQLASFNDLQFPSGFGNSITANRPTLRNLPGSTTAGGSTTLILLNGHRTVGVGITSTSPDPDVIPPGAVERLEVVTDGGSAVYGSDAVAGVMNFITRKKFDGVAVGGRAGFAKNYYQYNADLTVGKDWGNGGIYVSYAYAKNDELRGRDRDYVRSFPVVSADTGVNGLLALSNCNPGNVQITTAGVTTSYGLPGKAAVPNQCDPSDAAVDYPRLLRHSAMARLNQELSDNLAFDLEAYYTHREQVTGLGLFHPAAVTMSSSLANPTAKALFLSHQIGTEASHVVSYSFGGTNATDQKIAVNTWGVTPTFTYKLGSSWQAKLLLNYGESITESHQKAFNATALSNAITNGLFNPYDPSLSDPAALAIITNFETYGRTTQRFSNARLVADGDLFAVPGGAVKLAVGAEYFRENFDARFGSTAPGAQAGGLPAQLVGTVTVAPAIAALPAFALTRTVKSAFGEVVVPFVGPENATGGFQELRLSLAGRYDDYSDVGHTFNPKIGLTWKPAEFLTLRGNWGRSFNAPSLADSSSADFVTVIIRTAAQFGPPTAQQIVGGGTLPNVQPGDVTFLRRGNSPGIKPQKAETWSIGADLTPLEGVKLGASYYHMFVQGIIGLPNTNPAATFVENANVVTYAPSAAFISGLLASATAPLNNSTACIVNGANTCNVYAFVDLAKNNLGDFKLGGLDLSANITHQTSFGSISLDVNGNYELMRQQRSSPTAAWFNLLAANNSRFRVRSVLSAQVHDLLAQITWNHSGGYALNPAVGFVPQSSVASYDVFNLFFKYDFKGSGATKDLSMTLGVDNVFDKNPPVYRLYNASQYQIEGFINGRTLGRLVQVGLNKKF